MEIVLLEEIITKNRYNFEAESTKGNSEQCYETNGKRLHLAGVICERFSLVADGTLFILISREPLS